MEHIPRAQPRSCLYALSQCLQLPVPDTRSILQEKKSSAVVVISTEDTRSILLEKQSSAVIVILQQLCVFYLLPILDTLRCHHSINSQRARALARAFRIWRMHMQIIAVGVTNRRDQTRSAIYSFRGPFWTDLTHVRAFSFDF